jgi:hypothetical protein
MKWRSARRPSIARAGDIHIQTYLEIFGFESYDEFFQFTYYL